MAEVTATAVAPASPTPQAEPAGVSFDTTDEPLIPRDAGAGAELLVQAEPSAAQPGVKAEAAPAAEKQPAPAKQETPAPPGFVPQELFNRHKSILDQREAQTRKELNDLRAQFGAQAIEREVAGYRQAWAAKLAAAELAPGEFADQITAGELKIRETAANREKIATAEARAAGLEQEVLAGRQQTGSVILTAWVRDLIGENKITESADKDLINRYARQMPPLTFDQQGNVSPDYVEAGNGLAALAQRLGEAKKAIAAANKAQIEKVPAGQVYETAGGGGAMTDRQYVVASNAGTVPFDAIKLQAAMRRMGTAD